MTTISCETILTSNLAGTCKRLSTFLWTYPRWIHAEGRTHRLLSIGEDFEILVPTPSPMESVDLSRNAASSRAIPVQKMIDAILADPAVPLFWGKNVGGMQAKEELGPVERQRAYDIWMQSMESQIAYAKAMCALGIDDDSRPISAHKQIVNRMLEPYMHIKVLVSATEWSNFIGLRDHGDAEPHIQLLAQETRKELEKPAMQELQEGQWHMPFVGKWSSLPMKGDGSGVAYVDDFIKQSVACCASTSYKTVDGFDMTPDRAIALHDKLVSASPLHASPAEHVAQADRLHIAHEDDAGAWHPERWENPKEHGNFVGFRQYRKMLPNECL